MKTALMDVLACPTCLGELIVKGTVQSGDLREGELECKRCSMTFQVRDGVCVFGMRKDDRALKTRNGRREQMGMFR